MKLEINSDRLIREVQTDFNKAFPFLKIEFFHRPAGGQQVSSTRKMIAATNKIQEAGKQSVDGAVELADEMTVSQLEKFFREQLGLSIQVFRKSGNVWLETTMTDNWTLRQQNEHGKEISGVPFNTINGEKNTI